MSEQDLSSNGRRAASPSVYDDAFYKAQIDGSYGSANRVLRHLWAYWQPDAVLDVGCGRGTWLKSARELGSRVVFGLDGQWNSKAKLIDQAIEFRSIDLNKPFDLDRRFDLVISLEVAEHLEPSSAGSFVKSLTDHADAVLFGAAYSNQGGTNHINEQQHTYWARIFQQYGYAPFDLFRAAFWGDDEVCYWYRQNTYLYVKKDSVAYGAITSKGATEMRDLDFMNCIHPRLFEQILAARPSFKDHVKDLVPSLFRAVKYRTGRS